MIKAVVFDCFGVLAVDGWLPFKEKYFGNDPALYEQATNLNKQSDAGLIGYPDYIANIAALAHTTSNEVHAALEDNPPNMPLFEYIQSRIAPHYQLGMLSNAPVNWLGDIFTPDQIGLFEAIALSCDTGFIKPDPRAYEAVISMLGVEPDECVFVDDQERYCMGAKEVGMQAVQYRTISQCTGELDAILNHT